MAQIATIKFKPSKWSRRFFWFPALLSLQLSLKNGFIPFQKIEAQSLLPFVRQP